jgi:hypothetical protein
MNEGGINGKSLYYKGKKGITYNTDQLILNYMLLSKLRQNGKISKSNLYKMTLDFDEFTMFICQQILYMKNNGLGPKAWAE